MDATHPEPIQHARQMLGLAAGYIAGDRQIVQHVRDTAQANHTTVGRMLPQMLAQAADGLSQEGATTDTTNA